MEFIKFKNNIKTLISFFWKNEHSMKMKLIFAFSLTLAMIIFNLGVPYVFKNIIELFAVSNNNYLSLIQILLILYGSLWTIGQIIGQVKTGLMFYLYERCIKNISLKIFEKLQSLSLRFHLERKTGSITNTVERAKSGFETVFLGSLLFLIPTTLEMTLATILLTYLYGFFYGTILFATISLYILFSSIALPRLEKLQNNYNEMRKDTSTKLVDNLLNYETTKYFCNELYDKKLCDQALQNQEKTGLRWNLCELLIQTGQAFIIGIGLLLLTIISGNAVINHTLTIGDFILINGYLMQFAMPLHQFGYILRQVRTGLNNLHDAFEIMRQEPEIVDAPNAINLKTEKAEIIFENVFFNYNSSREILKDVSFKVPAGKTVAIIGSTGSGKSTIARLLFRFYDINSGKILINGNDIRNITQNSLRSLIGIVPQDTVLFNNSLYFNIAYGKPTATKQEVENVIKLAHLDELIKKLPEGYNTIVGERGLKLSGGERQRVAIARMLLKNPLIYIFDEATSSLDVHTEHEIQKNIATISSDCTTIIIAHRLSTIEHADQVLVLENGKIIETGLFKDLNIYKEKQILK